MRSTIYKEINNKLFFKAGQPDTIMVVIQSNLFNVSVQLNNRL